MVVTGIRSSLQSSLNLKRDSTGVVDGIIAEDIGKFPDTNLAESLQRISGVSIDRTDNGEGQRITVRGVGPDHNLMLLNGRQMPAANIPANAAGISGSRAFDFSNLASEAISEMQVYKSARADTATGGIGATINVRTARPLDTPGLRASLGIKGVMDRSVRQMPSSYPGDSITPEISGIFSNTFADGRCRLGTADDYDGSIWTIDHVGRYFKRFSNANDPDFSDQFLLTDFQRLRARGIELAGEARFLPRTDYTNDLRTSEKSRGAYLQWRTSFEWMVPVNISAGIRHEKTQVTSIAQIFPPVGHIGWIDDDNFIMTPGTIPENVVDTGEYAYWLPGFDIRLDLRENLALRGSWGKSIGRPGWQDIQSGVSLATRYARQGGSGNGGDLGLLPLESNNLDLSLEWYYAEGSYASIGYFRKHINNFAGNTITTQSPFPQVLSPIGGGYWNDAISLGGCGENDLICIRNDIFTRHANSPGVDVVRQTISGGQPGDPPAQFAVLVPVNQRSDTLDGFEISVQHMFGHSGFGIAANYTKVDSGLRYDNARLEAQYPMVGLSDSANLVLFYEQHGWQIRAAYNWRDKFLSSTGGSGTVAPNPYYTERYGQLDFNVTRQVTGQLAVFIEAINLTDQTQRCWVRHPNMLGDAVQSGARYIVFQVVSG